MNSIIKEIKCEKLKCQVLQIRVCPTEMVLKSISLIYITFPFDIPVSFRRVSETSAFFTSRCTPNLKSSLHRL